MLQRNEQEELEQVNALYSLLEDRYKKRVRPLISSQLFLRMGKGGGRGDTCSGNTGGCRW